MEICVNSDGDYLKAVDNAVNLIAKIIKDENITIQNIVQHNYFSGKNCPRNIRAGKVPWSQFIDRVKSWEYSNTTSKTQKYRIFTGTYSTLIAAESAAQVMKKHSAGLFTLSRTV